MVHELKTWPEYFAKVVRGEKPFELRKNDRDFKRGDILLLREYNPDIRKYTGKLKHKRITYILHGGDNPDFGLKKGYCIMGLNDFN